MSEIARMVREFHETYDIPIRTVPVAVPAEADLRVRLLVEEVQEYLDAVEAGDLIEVADALADIAYVVYGSALAHGINLDQVVKAVHRSNMTKTANPNGGKILKGPGFVRPDIASAL